MRFRQLYFIALFSSQLINNAYTSIAGVSYRDDFDFEERNRNNKCHEGPPVFWYLGNAPIMPQIVPQIIPEFHVEFVEYTTTEIPTTQRILSPFEALFESFKRDISQVPVAPRVEMTREFGKVHVYRQPVSYNTMKMIQKLTKAYIDTMS